MPSVREKVIIEEPFIASSYYNNVTPDNNFVPPYGYLYGYIDGDGATPGNFNDGY